MWTCVETNFDFMQTLLVMYEKLLPCFPLFRQTGKLTPLAEPVEIPHHAKKFKKLLFVIMFVNYMD